MKKVYLAGGWFTPHTREIIDVLEVELEKIDGLSVYSPRRDGTKLTPNEFGNTEVRRRVFQDNVDNILDADFLVASVDGKDGHLDTGTVWEIGLATAYGIPVIGYEVEEGNGGEKLLGGVASALFTMCHGIDDLGYVVRTGVSNGISGKRKSYGEHVADNNRALIIGPDFSEDHAKVNLDILATVSGSEIAARLVDQPSTTPIGENADDMFNGVDYVIAVVDDRHPAVAWTMGQAYARNIPIISFTNHDYGVNLMLLLSIIRHVKGTETLGEFLKQVKQEGILNIEQIDYADVRAI